MRIVFLDAATLGDDLDLSVYDRVGTVTIYPYTAPEEIAERIADAEVIVHNKMKLNEANLAGAKSLRLICVCATGYDNIDVAYCRTRGIAVCNVVGYSTQSVAQLTVAMALSLMTHLKEYRACVEDGSYTTSGIPNCLTPVFHEIAGKTWGIVGYGNIGRQVARVADALGCRVLVCKRTPVADAACVDLDMVCKEADILSIHTPLNDSTRGMIDAAHIAMLKPGAIVINVARGAVTDEAALAQAVREKRIAGLGVDVFSVEPIQPDHPFYALRSLPNVCLTPHMAWGAHETRLRLMDEIVENICDFVNGGRRNRVDLVD